MKKYDCRTVLCSSFRGEDGQEERRYISQDFIEAESAEQASLIYLKENDDHDFETDIGFSLFSEDKGFELWVTEEGSTEIERFRLLAEVNVTYRVEALPTPLDSEKPYNTEF